MSIASAQTSAVPQSAFVARNWRDLIRPRKLEVDPDSLTDSLQSWQSLVGLQDTTGRRRFRIGLVPCHGAKYRS